MNKIRVSVVSYTNSLPFLHGIKASAKLLEQIDLSVDVPAECARKVIHDEADLGIIPVAALSKIPNHHIVTDYCIGSDGPVDSVFVFSSKPIAEIESLRLDHQSRTSNGLARILLKHYWKKDVKVVMEGDADAWVLIGDRTFGQKDKVPYVYDLGEVWKEFTGLPFAFAVWVANKKLPENFINDFNEALKIGVSNPTVIISELPENPDFNYEKYLTNYLDYPLDIKKREAIQRYLQYYRELEEIDFKGV